MRKNEIGNTDFKIETSREILKISLGEVLTHRAVKKEKVPPLSILTWYFFLHDFVCK